MGYAKQVSALNLANLGMVPARIMASLPHRMVGMMEENTEFREDVQAAMSQEERFVHGVAAYLASIQFANIDAEQLYVVAMMCQAFADAITAGRPFLDDSMLDKMKQWKATGSSPAATMLDGELSKRVKTALYVRSGRFSDNQGSEDRAGEIFTRIADACDSYNPGSVFGVIGAARGANGGGGGGGGVISGATITDTNLTGQRF